MEKSRTNVFLLLAAALLLVLVVAVGCGGGATTTTQAPAGGDTVTTAATQTSESTASTLAPAAETITLKFAAYHPASTDEAKLGQEFIDQVTARTNGAVKIEFFPGGALLKAADMYDGVVNGVADIGEGSLSYNVGKFPETDMASAPLFVSSSWIITHALNDFYQKYKPAEFNSTHVLWMWANGPAVLLTAKKPVKTLEELKGLKIRAQALTGQIAKSLGASPQSVAMNELYDGLSKGVVDGVLVDPSVLVSFKLGDVIKYMTDSSKAVGNSYVFYIVMNNDSWNKLPDDVKKVIDEVANELVEKTAVAINQEDIAGIEYAQKAGAEIIPLSDAEVAKWQAAVAPVVDDYIAALAKTGLSEASQREHLKFLQDKVAYYTEQQKTQGIPFPMK